jgi:hypothetical protein
MATELVAWAPEVEGGAVVEPARSAWVRSAEWLVPMGARLFGRRHFRTGVDRAACRTLYVAAARGALYAFAPPSPFTRVTRGRGRRPVDVYRGRAPMVSGLGGAGDIRLEHRRGAGGRGALVVVNRGVGAGAEIVARRLAAHLVTIGFDVVLPGAGGAEGADEREWARSIAAVLGRIVRGVHEGVAIESWARQLGYRSVVATGIGLGGTVAALLAATTSRFDAVVPILAGAHPGRLWLPPRALARSIDVAALARDDVRQPRTLLRLFDVVAPGRLAPPRRREGLAVVGLRYDTHVPPSDVQALADHWRVRPVWLARAHVELPACARALAAIVAHAVSSGVHPRPL